METNSDKSPGPVPDELVEQLHTAIDHFHKARENLEEQMKDTDQQHQERVNAAADGVRAAEREVEEISDKISQELRSQEPGSQHQTDGAPRAIPAEAEHHVADFEPL